MTNWEQQVEDIKYVLICIMFFLLIPVFLLFAIIIFSPFFQRIEDYCIKKGWIK
jgi:hypothetical protein